MKAQTLIEILDAGHLTRYVNFDYEQRGGMILVGPPSALKSTMIERALEIYPTALILSDINVTQLMTLRDDLAASRYVTMGFTELEKIYQRQAVTAMNVEGHLKALVEEGFCLASFEDQRKMKIKARAFVVGAMTYALYDQRFTLWMKNGFARRFIWCGVRMADPELIMNAIHDGKKIPLGNITRKLVTTGLEIQDTLTQQESNDLRQMVKEQPGQETPYVLMKKIACVLKWKYPGKKGNIRVWELIEDFAPCMQRNGTPVTIPDRSKKGLLSKRQSQRVAV